MNILCESPNCKFVKKHILSGWVCSRDYIKMNKFKRCVSYEKGKERKLQENLKENKKYS